MALNPAEQSVPDIPCRQVAEWTSAYLDTRVKDATTVRMALHLAACAGCAAYVKQIATVRSVLRRLPGSGADSTQRDRLRRAFIAQRVNPQSKA